MLFASCWRYLLTDDDIAAAQPFAGYSALDRTTWPPPYYPWSPVALPAHAWHVRCLAEAMAATGSWIGPPPVLRGNELFDGNHRALAVLWLKAVRGITIDIPEPIRHAA